MTLNHTARLGSLRMMGLSVLMIAFMAVPSGLALSSENVIEVFPTGDPLQDIPNIRGAVAAVKEGGTVLLRATGNDGNPTAFNFGQIFPATLQEAFAQREQNSVNIEKSLRARFKIV